MKLPVYIAEQIQERLASLAVDCDYARTFYQRMPSEIDVEARWKLSLEVLYRLFLCSLIVPGHYRRQISMLRSEKVSEKLFQDCKGYLLLLAETDPESVHIEDYVVWQEWDLCIGEMGKELLRKHQIFDSNSALSNDFIADIEKLFSEEGVGWDDAPLLKK
ncbi:hypothetical protein I5R65_09405 [Herbaspirillum sp. AP02]|uniref:hypothetical protein n=1 Tax=unclassified Herbaspirillum TaxID=2624150 RepID=UPI0015DA50A4|nr:MULTISPECIES: hypothetical protein [unclassified Herbaspirillum]MBG7619676.1 hypothetical protein [Herbaspirillum sp. AP02]NZD69747.1 hypothetical protein [Herbaspirillum sp. AP21]